MVVEGLDLGDDGTARAVHEVGVRAYRVEAALIGSDAIPALGETLEQLSELPLHWLGHRADRTPVAFLAWARADAGEVDVHRLCVDPAWFRRGLARALLTELLVRTEGDVLVSTGAANHPAVALYQGAGFTRTGTVEPVPGLRVATFLLRRT